MMTRITITIDDKTNAQMICKLLSELKFVKSIETEEGYKVLEDEELKMLEDRWEDYVKNPEIGIEWEKVKAEAVKKHG